MMWQRKDSFCATYVLLDNPVTEQSREGIKYEHEMGDDNIGSKILIFCDAGWWTVKMVTSILKPKIYF